MKKSNIILVDLRVICSNGLQQTAEEKEAINIMKVGNKRGDLE